MNTDLAYAKKDNPSFIGYYEQYGRSLVVRLDSAGHHASVGGLLRFLNGLNESA